VGQKISGRALNIGVKLISEDRTVCSRGPDLGGGISGHPWEHKGPDCPRGLKRFRAHRECGMVPHIVLRDGLHRKVALQTAQRSIFGKAGCPPRMPSAEDLASVAALGLGKCGPPPVAPKRGGCNTMCWTAAPDPLLVRGMHLIVVQLPGCP
jgi:hypothetical protein